MTPNINKPILEYIKNYPLRSSKDIYDSLGLDQPGKKSFGLLMALLQKKLKGNPQIVKSSEYLKDKDLEEYAKSIWE